MEKENTLNGSCKNEYQEKAKLRKGEKRKLKKKKKKK